MLSLLSLLLTSGAVLQADTEGWTPASFPNPIFNADLCNVRPNSTICDPDHVLTDQWRDDIDSNLRSIMEDLENANIQYADDAPESCILNSSEPVKIYLVLAKKIKNFSNESLSNDDLTTFGNELLEAYGLNNAECKNFLILIGGQQFPVMYVRSGIHLKLPTDMMKTIFERTTDLFAARNYMEMLSKIVKDTGREMLLAFGNKSTDDIIDQLETESHASETTHKTLEEPTSTTFKPFLRVFKVLLGIVGLLILLAFVTLALQFLLRGHQKKPVETQTVVSITNSNLSSFPHLECRQESREPTISKNAREEDPYMTVTKRSYALDVKDKTERPQPVGGSAKEEERTDENVIFNGFPEETINCTGETEADCEKAAARFDQKRKSTKVKVNPIDLSTDFVRVLSPFQSFQSSEKY
ncbi:hypothetical protein L596_003426 [Steinernema carpocapsae]|uniref:SEA domain-containing protein n=1 Tax=Steinernema carpocapsae TaxID=34508 RepID=A0A4U8UVJ4_STECR|nr:hypothetical protein L596_003426 [Steinernema carpocapsae]